MIKNKQAKNPMPITKKLRTLKSVLLFLIVANRMVEIARTLKLAI